jgi:hypothetical protein
VPTATLNRCEPSARTFNDSVLRPLRGRPSTTTRSPGAHVGSVLTFCARMGYALTTGSTLISTIPVALFRIHYARLLLDVLGQRCTAERRCARPGRLCAVSREGTSTCWRSGRRAGGSRYGDGVEFQLRRASRAGYKNPHHGHGTRCVYSDLFLWTIGRRNSAYAERTYSSTTVQDVMA